MIDDLAEVDVKNLVSLEGINFTTGGELVLNQLGIDLTKPQLADISPWKFAHYMAVENWLTEYQPKPNSSNLEQVRGYLEAFHHLCEVSDWEKASKILFIRSNYATNTKHKDLHEQLFTWGYYQEQIDLYSRLLDKLNPELNCILLHGLGRAYGCLGQPQPAIEFHQLQLDIARKINNRKAEVTALGGLGRIYYWCLGEFETAINYCQKQLAIAREIGDREQEIQALDWLGGISNDKADFQKAIKYRQAALTIAEDIGDSEMEVVILSGLGATYSTMGQPKKAIEFLQQVLDVSQKTGNCRQEWAAMNNLGIAYMVMNQNEKAIDILQEAIVIIRNLGDKVGETVTLDNLCVTNVILKKYDLAIEYCQASLKIYQKVGILLGNAYTLINLSYCYGCLKESRKAISYSNKAIKIAHQSNNQYLKGLALAVLANAYWHKGNYIFSLMLITRSMLIVPPWKGVNGLLIFKLTIRIISQKLTRVAQYFLNIFQFENNKETA